MVGQREGMQNSDTLMTFAELALALVGFGGIVVALGQRSQSLTPARVFSATALITLGIGAMAVAVLPIVLVELGASTATALRSSSAVMAVHAIAWFTYLIPTSRRFDASREVPRRAFGLHGRNPALLGASGLNVVAQLASASGLSDRPFGVLIAGLSWYLVGGLVAFLMFLVDPAE
jgi:hypothetical protein